MLYYYDSEGALYRAITSAYWGTSSLRTDAIERATSRADRIRAFVRAQARLLGSIHTFRSCSFVSSWITGLHMQSRRSPTRQPAPPAACAR